MFKKLFTIFCDKRKEKINKEIEMLMLYKLESKVELNEVQLDCFYFLLKQLNVPEFDAIKGFQEFKKNHLLLIEKLIEQKHTLEKKNKE